MKPISPWDKTVDLLVVGGGAGGLCAALLASLAKLDVLLVEKTEQVGGTASTSAGSLWIPGNRQGREAGFTDDARSASQYLLALQGASSKLPAVEAYLADGPGVIDRLERHTEVKFVSAGFHPDYNDLPGAATTGRVIVPKPFDGRLLGHDFKRVRAPIDEFMLFGGMMVGKPDLPFLIGRYRSLGNFVYSAKLMLRYLTDRIRYSRGTRLMMGNALVARLLYSLKQRQVPISFGTSLLELVQGERGVEGAVLASGGSVLRVRALRGVVLATGGFGHNESLRKEFLPQPTTYRSLAFQGNTGDGIELGRRAGASVEPAAHRHGAFWTPVSVTSRADGSSGLFPHLLLDRAKPGVMAVNAAGRRFVNEGCSYHDFVCAMYESNQTVPTFPSWLVCSAATVSKYGLGHVYPGTDDLSRYESKGYVRTALTLEELAEKIQVDPQGLVESARRMDKFAETGIDADFGKGSTQLNRVNGDPDVKPNPCLAPIGDGPYCAMALWAAEIAASTGLEADEHARVLDTHGAPVPGLYACGNDMASIFKGTYPGPGTTLGPAFVFASRAVSHAAAAELEAGSAEARVGSM